MMARLRGSVGTGTKESD